MKATGIICEYNPFHAGHAYLLQKAGGEGITVCLMSGFFVQRGEAAILPPTYRAQMALGAGADLVLELPFPYAAGSARYFASAGVRALAALGCDTLCFGSESADKQALLDAAAQLLRTPDPAERDQSLGDAAAHFAALDEAPASNDILALEYTRAILAEGLEMQIAPVLRVGAGYREITLGEGFPSATALRRGVARGEDISPLLPAGAAEIWQRALAECGGVADTARLGSALLARLRTDTQLARFADCGGGLAAHLSAAAWAATDYSSLCERAATKRYTNGRIRRAMLYLLAGVLREDLQAPPAYLRLLGATPRGREFLSLQRRGEGIPVVTKQSDIAALGAPALRQSELAQTAAALYALCMPRPTTPAQLLQSPPIIL